MSESDIKQNQIDSEEYELKVRAEWKVGSKLNVVSEISRKWVVGEIIQIYIDNVAEWLAIKCQNGELIKDIQRSNKNIAPILNQHHIKPQKSNRPPPINSITDDIKDNENKAENDNIEEKKEETELKLEELERFPVQVFVRMRPLVGLEISENHKTVKYGVKKIKKKKVESLTLKKVYGRNNERDKKYTGFKQIIKPNIDNIETFNKCLLPTIIPYIFNGDNCCIFAYGHTGSGKTHTIFGYKDDNVPGMYQLFARNIINDKRIKDEDDIFVEIRFCELYQGKVYDLLSGDKRECFIREDRSGIVHIRSDPVKCDDGKIRAYPISNAHIQNEDDLLNVIFDGIASRNVGHSTLHDKSSRSHAFLEFELVSTDLINERKKLVEKEADELTVRLIEEADDLETLKRRYYKKGPIPERKLELARMAQEATNVRVSLKDLLKQIKQIRENIKKITNDKNRPYIGGTVVFVDLAGNEYGRDVKSNDIQEQRERAEINKSLLALKECIRGLHSNKEHIGYRDSKLTMYLKEYLNGKDSKAIMISNIGSSQQYAKQTINTLQYSQLVANA